MLAERMNHLGTETAFEVLARANALEAEGRQIINLGIGQLIARVAGNIEYRVNRRSVCVL